MVNDKGMIDGWTCTPANNQNDAQSGKNYVKVWHDLEARLFIYNLTLHFNTVLHVMLALLGQIPLFSRETINEGGWAKRSAERWGFQASF